MSLFRLKQLAAIVEAVPGTLNTGVYSANQAQHLIRDASMEVEVATYERQFLRGTFTPLEGLPGRKTIRTRFSLELAPPSSGTTPPYDTFLRACGMASKALFKVTTSGALTITGGPLRHGELASQPAAGTTVGISGRVALDTYNGATELWLYDVTVTNLGYSGSDPSVGETLTGGTSGATGVITAVTGGSNVLTVVLTGGAIFASGEALTASITGSIGTASTGSIHATDDITGATTSAAVTSASLAVTGNAGRSWFPLTFTNITLNHASGTTPSAGDIITGGTSGAIGIVESSRDADNKITIRVYNAKNYSNGETLTAATAGALGAASNVAQADIPTISIAGYADGRRLAASGCRGTFSVAATIGESVFLNFDFTGSYADDDDIANLSGVTYPLRVPSVFLSVGALLGTEQNPTVAPTYAPRFRTVTLNLGHQIEYREDANSSSGVLEAMLVGRRGSGSIDPEQDLEASYPALTNFLAGNAGNLRFNVGSAAPSKFIVSVAGMSTSSMTQGDRNGIATNEVNFNLTGGHYENASDTPGENNDLVIVYAAA